MSDHLSDAIDYCQQRRENLGDLMAETLKVLENSGGKVSYISLSLSLFLPRPYTVGVGHFAMNNVTALVFLPAYQSLLGHHIGRFY